MIFDLPFDVVFCSDYKTEAVIDGWEQAEAEGYTYYQTQRGSLCFFLLEHIDGQMYLKVFNSGDEEVSGFVGVRFPWRHGDDCYTLIPAIYYDGNGGETYEIPKISLPEIPKFSASVSAVSYPTVIAKDGARGYAYDFSPTSFAGWNGIELDAERSTFTIFAPAKEEKIYECGNFRDNSRPAFTWRKFSTVCIRFRRSEFDCPEVKSVFDYHWNTAIRNERYPAANAPKLAENEGVSLVRDWVYDMHMLITPKDEPLILTAFMDPNNRWPSPVCAEWGIQIGWSSGTLTALPMLKFGGKYREFALRYFDFISTNGNSPSGVKYSVYDGDKWMTPDHPEFHNRDYNHIRFWGDHLYYLGRAITFEREAGNEHPLWVEEFRRGVDIIKDVWRREHDFGYSWNIEGERVEMKRRGTTVGAYCLLALSEAVSLYPDEADLRGIFEEACAHYYNKWVLRGHTCGGPTDILDADDSESCATLANALVRQYQLLGGEDKLTMATDACKMFATWVVNYQPAFPGGSMFEGINVCGGVIANVQNRHIGPGICVNSARFLYDIGEITGDTRFCDLYYRIKHAAINMMSSYTGEFFGLTFDSPFMKGMLSEQINITDALNPAGETWKVSACWPASAVLMGWFDTPDTNK